MRGKHLFLTKQHVGGNRFKIFNLYNLLWVCQSVQSRWKKIVKGQMKKMTTVRKETRCLSIINHLHCIHRLID